MQTEAEAFLQRIRAYPDDDAPRLIFADWLDEQADPRGSFIRVQLALAQIAADAAADGPAARDATRAAIPLQLAERDLLDAHREEWTAPFRGLATGPEFRRGFVEVVNVAAREFLGHAHELFAASPIRHVHLLDVGGSLPAVLQCPYLARLAALTIHAQHAGEALARAVGRSPHLTGLKLLRLSRNRFENDAAEHLATAPALAGLEELDLAENDFGETGARGLAASPNFAALRRLELAGNRLGPAGAEAIAASERLPHLQRLGLSGNEIGAARLHSLGRAHALLRVPVLDLSANGLGPLGLQVILTRPTGPAEPAAVAVRELDLSHNDLGDGGARILARCAHLADLRVLRLAGCGIDDGGARVLAEAPYLNNLVSLDLMNNPIGEAGFRPFLEPSHLRALRRLNTPLGIGQRMQYALDQRFLRDRR